MAKNYIQNMLGENERIVLITRQHGFVLFSSIIAEIVVTLIVIVAITAMAIANPRWHLAICLPWCRLPL